MPAPRIVTRYGGSYGLQARMGRVQQTCYTATVAPASHHTSDSDHDDETSSACPFRPACALGRTAAGAERALLRRLHCRDPRDLVPPHARDVRRCLVAGPRPD